MKNFTLPSSAAPSTFSTTPCAASFSCLPFTYQLRAGVGGRHASFGRGFPPLEDLACHDERLYASSSAAPDTSSATSCAMSCATLNLRAICNSKPQHFRFSGDAQTDTEASWAIVNAPPLHAHMPLSVFQSHQVTPPGAAPPDPRLKSGPVFVASGGVIISCFAARPWVVAVAGLQLGAFCCCRKQNGDQVTTPRGGGGENGEILMALKRALQPVSF